MHENERIPFNRPFAVGRELQYIQEAIDGGHLSGDGIFTKRCHAWLEGRLGAARALLTHSCTGALEMSAILAEIGPGDEVIMPSFTFVSTANAFVLRGAVPVFIDIRSDTLNLDETLVEAAITSRTRAIVPVHYAGVACAMDQILDIASRHGVVVIEDAAQALLAAYKGRALGSFGQLAALSFHETKVVISGEGGSLIINDPNLIARAEIIREKGTNRSQFFRGEVAKYTWVDLGSSYLPSEIIAGFLWAQLQSADEITRARAHLWKLYHDGLADLERRGRLRRPVIPPECQHNSHLYYILLPTRAVRDDVLRRLNASGLHAVFHYIPLHSSPGGLRYGKSSGELAVTDDVSGRLLRLPLWVNMGETTVCRVVEALSDAC